MGLRVWGLGFRVWGLRRTGVSGLGLRAWGHEHKDPVFSSPRRGTTSNPVQRALLGTMEGGREREREREREGERLGWAFHEFPYSPPRFPLISLN